MKSPIQAAILSLVALLTAANDPATANEPAHWVRAMQYTMDIDAVNNVYGPDCDIYYDDDEVLHARSKCGSYVAKVWRQSYPGLQYSVMSSLFEWGSPNARRWYDGINEQRTHDTNNGTFGTVVLTSVWDLSAGDVLVSKYQKGSSSGHVMMFDMAARKGVLDVEQIPGYNEVEVFAVSILDCTSSPHGDCDTRKGAEPDNTDDQGIGRALIYIMADPETGEMVGWTWSTISSTIYQCTDSEADNYRPLIGGYIYGPGI